MKKRNLLVKLWHVLLFAGLIASGNLSAQYVDATGTFDPVLEGEHTVYAGVVFNDLGTIGTFDCAFALSDVPIVAYTDYAVGVAFYNTGISIRVGSAFVTPSNPIIPVSGQFYHLWITINVPAKKYNVYVMTEGLLQPTLVHSVDGDFRKQSTQINRWSAFHNPSGQPDYLTVQKVATNLPVGTTPVEFGESRLASLSTNYGTLSPAFSPDNYDYSVVVPFGTEIVNVNATALGVGAKIEGTGPIQMEDGFAYAIITVTSGTGDKSEYTIEIVQAGGEGDASLKSLTVGANKLKPTFNRDVLNYEVMVENGTTSVEVEALPTNGGASVTGTGTINIVDGIGTATITVKSQDLTTTTVYTVTIIEKPLNLIENWDGNDAVGEGSQPNNFGWAGTNVTEWGLANVGGIRYVDITTPYTYNGVADWTGRVLYPRWDGVGGSNTTTVYSYPVQLEACKSYSFTGKYAWLNNGNSPTYKVGINSAADNSGVTLVTKDYYVATRGNILYDMDFTFTPPTSGTYYLTIACNQGSLMAIADLLIGENTQKTINVAETSFKFSDNAKTASFTVYANGLSEAIAISAPAGITLDKTSVAASEAQCGVLVTATYDYSATLTAGDITLTSGTVSKVIPFTYTGPSILVYESAIEVEDNGFAYPLTIASVENSVATLTVEASAGFTASQTAFTTEDFTTGLGKVVVNISSNAAVGTTGTITLSSGTTVLATINVKKVAPYARYTIMQRASGFLIGSHSSGLYPALTDIAGVSSQRFFFREVEPGVFNIVQDETYKVIRKDPASAWNTEFGVPANEAKWTIQSVEIGAVTFTNVVTGKVLGTDTPVADARLYDDKTHSAGGNTEWIIANVSTVNNANANLANLSLSVGSITPQFDAAVTSYNAVLPFGTTSVKPIAVPVDFGATIMGVGSVDVTEGTGVSTIVVTAPNGVATTTYTINYTIATGVKDAKSNNILVYPTVTKGNVTVKTAAPSTITVMDLTGKTVSKQVTNANIESLQIAAPGIYLVKIESKRETKVVKVVKTK